MITYDPDWTDKFLTISAYNKIVCLRRVGIATAEVLPDGTGFICDIHVEEEITTKGKLWGLWKRKLLLRGSGIGSTMLDVLEEAMNKKGVSILRGNLVPETPDKVAWLINWYQKRGYQFIPNETAGAWAPPNTRGVVIKNI